MEKFNNKNSGAEFYWKVEDDAQIHLYWLLKLLPLTVFTAISRHPPLISYLFYFGFLDCDCGQWGSPNFKHWQLKKKFNIWFYSRLIFKGSILNSRQNLYFSSTTILFDLYLYKNSQTLIKMCTATKHSTDTIIMPHQTN